MKEGINVKQLIQVTYVSSLETIEKREINSLITASNELRCDDLLMLTWDYGGNVKVEDKNIVCMPVWKWLLVNSQ